MDRIIGSKHFSSPLLHLSYQWPRQPTAVGSPRFTWAVLPINGHIATSGRWGSLIGLWCDRCLWVDSAVHLPRAVKYFQITSQYPVKEGRMTAGWQNGVLAITCFYSCWEYHKTFLPFELRCWNFPGIGVTGVNWLRSNSDQRSLRKIDHLYHTWWFSLPTVQQAASWWCIHIMGGGILTSNSIISA